MNTSDNLCVFEWMDHVDAVVTMKSLIPRLDEYYVETPRVTTLDGVITARPNWLAKEIEELGDSGTRFWQGYKQLRVLKRGRELTFPYQKGVNETKIRQLEKKIFKLCDRYYDEALKIDMSEKKRQKYRGAATQLLESLEEQNPEQVKADELAEELALLSGKYPKRSRYASPFGVIKFLFKLLFYPIFLFLLINATGIYITVWAVFTVFAIVSTPFIWMFGSKDSEPFDGIKVMLYAAGEYMKGLTVGYWKD